MSLANAQNDHFQLCPVCPPSQPKTLFPLDARLLAYLYFKQQRWHEGRIALEKAAALYSNRPDVYQACGQFALLQDRQADAWAHFRMALHLKPPEAWAAEDQRNFKANCYARMTDVAERRKDWANAIALFEDWNAVATLDSNTQFRWARALLSSGNEQAAFGKLKAAHQSDANFNPPELAMGAIYTELGQIRRRADAQQWLESAGVLLGTTS